MEVEGREGRSELERRDEITPVLDYLQVQCLVKPVVQIIGKILRA